MAGAFSENVTSRSLSRLSAPITSALLRIGTAISDRVWGRPSM